jgi:hypothetical protein
MLLSAARLACSGNPCSHRDPRKDDARRDLLVALEANDLQLLGKREAPSTCQVGLAGCRRRQGALGIYDQPMLQISAQTWNVWVLEALCSAAVR